MLVCAGFRNPANIANQSGMQRQVLQMTEGKVLLDPPLYYSNCK
jgi:hypothetical protein